MDAVDGDDGGFGRPVPEGDHFFGEVFPEFFSLDEIEYEESTFDLSQPQAVYRSLAFAPNITIEKNGNNDSIENFI